MLLQTRSDVVIGNAKASRVKVYPALLGVGMRYRFQECRFARASCDKVTPCVGLVITLAVARAFLVPAMLAPRLPSSSVKWAIICR
jgi:hypothetical protein